MLSPRLSVTLFTLYFLVSGPGMGGRQFPSISFCLYVVALSVYRASNVWGHQLLCAPVAVGRSISNGDQQLNEAGLSVLMLMKGFSIPGTELNTVRF